MDVVVVNILYFGKCVVLDERRHNLYGVMLDLSLQRLNLRPQMMLVFSGVFSDDDEVRFLSHWKRCVFNLSVLHF